jgi:hypothetical protein
MSFLDSLTGMFGFSNPANAAMPYLNGIQGQISPYYQPYIDAGKNSLNPLMGQYNSLISDPGARMNQIGAGFDQSPGYRFNLQQALQGSNSAAGAGGMLGSPMHQQQSATLAHNLANQDYGDYMNRATGYYNQGLGGMNNMANMGMNAGNELAQALANIQMSQAGMAYSGQNNQNAANQNMLGNLIGLGGAISSFF